MDNITMGKIGEDAATAYLCGEDYEIMARNFKCKTGEIDVIATRDNTLHFIEVKTRTDDAFGQPCESVTDEKLEHIKKVAAYYGNYIESRYEGFQIDVIEVGLNHIENVVLDDSDKIAPSDF